MSLCKHKSYDHSKMAPTQIRSHAIWPPIVLGLLCKSVESLEVPGAAVRGRPIAGRQTIWPCRSHPVRRPPVLQAIFYVVVVEPIRWLRADWALSRATVEMAAAAAEPSARFPCLVLQYPRTRERSSARRSGPLMRKEPSFNYQQYNNLKKIVF